MLTLICGIPNAGKTTYSARYDNVIHLDDLLHLGSNEMYAQTHRLLSDVADDVAVEGVYGSVKRRKQLLEVCSHQDRKVCVWIDTDVEKCIEREKAYRRRPLGLVYVHHKQFEPPTLDEGWDEIVVLKGDL